MKNEGWPTFSFTDLLRPPEGWRTEHALLTTYSVDLVVIVTSLLALTGCDLDLRRAGSRVELVKAIEALRGRVCILAQHGRVTIPGTPRPILKLLDSFLRTVETDENVSSWHPKIALLRFHRQEEVTDRQWRIWLGSRNLTRSMNWEAGLILASRTDGRGRWIAGLAKLGKEIAKRSELATLTPSKVEAELSALTWECPPGSDVQSVHLFGPGLTTGFPKPPADTERVFVVSPFLDAKTVRMVAGWGGPKTRRTLVSTALELQRLWSENDKAFAGFDVRVQPIPDLPAEGAEMLDEETSPAPESADSEEVPPSGLHAKLFFAAKGARRQLWLGSANATERGWEGRNYEVVADLSISREAATAIEGFVAECGRFNPSGKHPGPDEDEDAVEQARKLLCGQWPLGQRVGDNEVEVVASVLPPLTDPLLKLEVALLGGTWTLWPVDRKSIVFPGVRPWQRSDFLQVRLTRGNMKCSWLQIALCDRRPDEERDRALIAQYLNPRTFLMWLRSLLADQPARAGGGDWDDDPPPPVATTNPSRRTPELGLMPTVEEILRAWARDSSAFASADKNVQSYLHELEKRAKEDGATDDVKLLEDFRRTWDTLACELR